MPVSASKKSGKGNEAGSLVPNQITTPFHSRVQPLSSFDRLSTDRFTIVDLGASARVALMFTPAGGGPLEEQLEETLQAMKSVLNHQKFPLTVTLLTIFLGDASAQPVCERLFFEFFGEHPPIMSFVLQQPCSGAALAVEAWAIGGPAVKVQRYGAKALSVAYDHMRWTYCAGQSKSAASVGAYRQTWEALEEMRDNLKVAGADFNQVVRTWFYLGGITEPEAQTQRYKEFNRGRTDFYKDVQFCCTLLQPNIPHGVFPASTGIGASEHGLLASCLALQASRKDIFLLPLENPQQTPAYAYHPRYSEQSPKFSRAMSLVLDSYVTTWVSGTASVINSESRHLGDIDKQVHQTIDNMERLIAPENFTFHGVKGAGAGLKDFTKIRVYVKRQQDFAVCQRICQERFGNVPAVYALADVCRPELLVEIEGVAFSRYEK